MIRDLQFDKERITIGRNRHADLFLDHSSVADIHALVHFDKGQAFLTNQFPQNGLRLNGRSVHKAELRHEDVIAIGPYTLKIKMPVAERQPDETASSTYCVRLVNRYDSPEALHHAAANLAGMLRASQEKIRPLMAKDHCIIKRGLTGIEAAQIQNALLRAGVVCDVQVELQRPMPRSDKEPSSEDGESVSRLAPAEPVEFEDTEDSADRLDLSPETWVADDEVDEEGNIWEAPFSLKDELARQSASRPLSGGNLRLQVVKIVGDAVIDRVTLKRRQKYHIHAGKKAICLAHYRPDGAMVFFTKAFRGYVRNAAGEATADLDGFKTETYRTRRRRHLYGVDLPQQESLVLEDGSCEYQIAWVDCPSSPQVTASRAPSSFDWRHWASSVGLHFLVLLAIAVTSYFQASPEEKALHFVKIDPSMLQQLEPPKPPPKPKQQPPPPKPEPAKPVKVAKPAKTKPPKKKAVPPVNTAQKTKPRKQLARVAQPSKHAKAGGGFGEGNIKNRNINQTGILSVLGNASLAGPSEAIASVTNLDAVAVPGATEKNFSVGGLKGSLGNGKISVASGEIVQTKGSKQVLRSAGARGKGDVAALERGSTGNKQVQAMVTARMTRTVKIEGGMSREMVKRVIDQHLEEITYCYETALMSNPTILGRIVFEWKILMDGRVGEVRIVASSVNSNTIHGCIKSAIKSWQFPKPVGAEVVVSYPFVFDLVAF
jgi:outer membrane biosynthesis protein TonB